MHVLIVYSHPNPDSFNHALLDLVKAEIKKKKHTVSIRDLYALDFQPTLKMADLAALKEGKPPKDIVAEQKEIDQADMIIVIHPVWWLGIPAILKGWFDRVFSYGYAYCYDDKGILQSLLAGKKAIVINTTGCPEQTSYIDTGLKEAFMKALDLGIYGFVGMEVVLHRMFFSLPRSTPEERADMMMTLKADLKKLL